MKHVPDGRICTIRHNASQPLVDSFRSKVSVDYLPISGMTHGLLMCSLGVACYPRDFVKSVPTFQGALQFDLRQGSRRWQTTAVDYKSWVKMWCFTVSWLALYMFLAHSAEGIYRAPAKSCLDHLKHGATKNGYFTICDRSGRKLSVYCDFKSEPGSAWTLVMSWANHNRALPAFKSVSLIENAKVNEKTPNWFAYRQSRTSMRFLKSRSTHWRATCNFNKVKFDYRDYMRGNFRDTDITTYLGLGQCKKIEFINIRGHVGYQTHVALWQKRHTFIIHTDTWYRSCPYKAFGGAVNSEDNFGHHVSINKKFRCTSGPSATTQYWFGGYVS